MDSRISTDRGAILWGKYQDVKLAMTASANDYANYGRPPQFQEVYIDTHIYHAFGGARQGPTPWSNVWYTCNSDLPMINSASWTDWTIVGEWSLAIADTSDDSTDDDALLSWRRSFFTSQMDVYTNRGNPSGPAKGQFFWNFKSKLAVTLCQLSTDKWNRVKSRLDMKIGISSSG
jgi:hypothetical protein